LNLDYFIMAEEGDAGSPVPPGSVRVTMDTGKEFDLSGAEAEEFRRGAARAIREGPPSGAGEASAAVRVRVNPSADTIGVFLEDPPGEREAGG
jgi:hypothetical protein